MTLLQTAESMVARAYGSGYTLLEDHVVDATNQLSFAVPLDASCPIVKVAASLGPAPGGGQEYAPPAGWTVALFSDAGDSVVYTWIDPTLQMVWFLDECIGYGTSTDATPGSNVKIVKAETGLTNLLLAGLGGLALWWLYKAFKKGR